MVRIASPNRTFQIAMPTLEHLSAVQLPDYWIDRHEVTNRAFKRFVDDGGYRRAELWREPFLKDGRTLTFDEAMKYFRDATGQPGPAEWEQGTYAAGQDEYPVGGVSWYEAAAYARWAGKSLPTIYHWTRAAGLRLSGDVVPASNFNGKSPIPVGTSGGHHARRHDRHGWQRERVGVECRRRESVHPGRRVERTGVHVHRRGCAGAFYPRSEPWIPLHPARSARGPVAGADRRHRGPIPRLAKRQTGQFAGFRGVAQPLLLRSRRSEGAGGIGGRYVPGLAQGKGQLRRGVW